MSLPILVRSAPQVALPGGTDGCRALLGLPRGYLHWQARACMCTVGQWPRAHNISLHPSTLMLEGAHAAEVRGDSAAITLYWSEGVRSNIHSHNLCDHRSDRFAHTHIALVCLCERRRALLLRRRLFWSWMDRPVISNGASDSGFDVETEVRPFGSRSGWKQDADLDLLHRRFPTHCPYHLLHNLLQLHYGRHEMCTALPFSVDVCKHGSHAKPVLTHNQMRADTPAEGGLLLLPFGLSCRACDDDVGLVAGCAECELLDDGDFCGGCRRIWVGGQPLPATQLLAAGRPCDLEEWQRAVGLGEQVPSAGGPTEPEEYPEEEWLGEEEWEGEEEEEDRKAEAEEWKYAGEAEAGGASWGAEGEADYGGDDDGSASAGYWGDGRWAEDPHGSWSWVVDFAAPRCRLRRARFGRPGARCRRRCLLRRDCGCPGGACCGGCAGCSGCCFRVGRLRARPHP
mmetsp:Transcript_52055/g.138210  ORF Transcript_52055/g.138210 Transcript_52055/m.138210 type:complete len:456 (+) Transcript_52055:409-1776(+)